MPSCVRSGFSHFEMILSASATQRHVGERARTHERGHMHDIQRHEGLGEKFTPPHSLHTGVSAPRTIKSRLICYLTRLLPPRVHPRQRLTHPPCCAIHVEMSLSTTSPMVSTMPKRYSGWPCRTQSTARPPAVQYSETILHHEMSALNNSRAIELSTFRTDFSLVIVTETWGGKILCSSVQLMIYGPIESS